MRPSPAGDPLCGICTVDLALTILGGPNRAQRRAAVRASRKKGNHRPTKRRR